MLSQKNLAMIVLLTSLTTLILSSIIIGSINKNNQFKDTQQGKDARRSSVIILIASIFGVLAAGSFLFFTETQIGSEFRSQVPFLRSKSYIF